MRGGWDKLLGWRAKSLQAAGERISRLHEKESVLFCLAKSIPWQSLPPTCFVLQADHILGFFITNMAHNTAAEKLGRVLPIALPPCLSSRGRAIKLQRLHPSASLLPMACACFGQSSLVATCLIRSGSAGNEKPPCGGAAVYHLLKESYFTEAKSG
jgi:hypothetical protein